MFILDCFDRDMIKNVLLSKRQLGTNLGEGGGTLGISGWLTSPGWGCAAGTLEPLTYTRASSAEFCYPILE